MEKCLVTKLYEVVDADLLKVGEFRIQIEKIDSPTKYTQGLAIQAAKDITLQIIGDGYFTNADLTANLGKTLNVPAYATPDVYFSNGNYEISFSDKYSIINLSYINWGEINTLTNKKMEVESLAYSKNLVKLRFLNGLSGDFSKITTKMFKDVYIFNNKDLFGDISKNSFEDIITFSVNNTNLSGSTNGFKNNTTLVLLNVQDTKIVINTSDIKNSKVMETILGTLSGNLDDFKDIPTLSIVSVTAVNLAGDLALLPANFNRIEGNISNANFTWSSRPSSYKRFGIYGFPNIANIDKMLQDMAACADSSTNKSITVKGTRTTASDDAITTLQNDGWNIAITQ